MKIWTPLHFSNTTVATPFCTSLITLGLWYLSFYYILGFIFISTVTITYFLSQLIC